MKRDMTCRQGKRFLSCKSKHINNMMIGNMKQSENLETRRLRAVFKTFKRRHHVIRDKRHIVLAYQFVTFTFKLMCVDFSPFSHKPPE